MVEEGWQALCHFEMTSEPENERLAVVRVAEAIAPLGLSQMRQDQLKTAVGEAVLNAIEHGNERRPEQMVSVEVGRSPQAVTVRVTDRGTGGAIIRREAPDLAAKLAGHQPPRGWGLFLIERMVDELRIVSDADGHTVELVLYLDARGPAS